jgi:hypothetical protein
LISERRPTLTSSGAAEERFLKAMRVLGREISLPPQAAAEEEASAEEEKALGEEVLPGEKSIHGSRSYTLNKL